MYLYSNESVFRGHPDKVCDQISDAILDETLRRDKNSRVAVEVAGGKGKIFITGEITSSNPLNKKEMKGVVKRVLKSVGYQAKEKVIINVGKQSSEIALGTNDEVGGAGDNGMMFGYATNETPELLPKAQVILQRFAKKYDRMRSEEKNLLPDGKTQITGTYDERGRLKEIKTATICFQNTGKNTKKTYEKVREEFVKTVREVDDNLKIRETLLNPTGEFVKGGFEADAGLTGRKIAVDNYHSFSKLGGGAFSGKDGTKVDRSGAYKAREIAKRLLRERNGSDVKVQLSYAIGIETPLAIYIEVDGERVSANLSLYEESKPRNIIKKLNLKSPNFEEKARFGHFQGTGG